jgi:Fur family transcriptional regulator, ferric uptake regulator
MQNGGMANTDNIPQKTLECIAHAEDVFGEYLKKNNLSFTKARRNALKVIYSIDGHFDLESLKKRFLEMEVSFHFTSIFRLINVLVEAGMLEKIKTNSHRKVAYECSLCRQHHDHMVCNDCGQIIEFHNAKIEKLQEKEAEEQGFEILYHNLIITGICKNCRDRKKNERYQSPSNVVKQVD